MKRFFTILALALSLPAFGQKVKDFPNRATLQSNDLFSVSANAGAGTYHVSFGQVSNELKTAYGNFYQPLGSYLSTAEGIATNTSFKTSVVITNYDDSGAIIYVSRASGAAALGFDDANGTWSEPVVFDNSGITAAGYLGSGANLTGIRTNSIDSTFYSLLMAGASGGGGGGGDGWFWGTNVLSGESYTNKWGVIWDNVQKKLSLDEQNFIVTDNAWTFGSGIQNYDATTLWDYHGDFYGRFIYANGFIDVGVGNPWHFTNGVLKADSASMNSLTINSGGSFSTPALMANEIYATNFYPQGLSASNTFLKVSATGLLTNAWDGHGLTNLTYSALVDPTNVFYSTGTLNFAVPHSTTNMSGNLTFSAVSNFNTTNYNIAVIEMLANGADRTITCPAAWRLAPYGGTTFTVTNGTSCKLTVELQVSYFTNAYATWAY